MVTTGPDAPLAEALAVGARRRTHNFHALPLTAIRADLPEPWASAYRLLLDGGGDLSWSGAALDSPFRPAGPLRAAQLRAARFFDADDTWFVTGGTTVANRIALEATLEMAQSAPATVLLDPNCHQSAFFSAHGLGAEVIAAPSVPGRQGSAGGLAERRLDAAGTEEVLRSRRRAGRPVTALVLTAAPYDGTRVPLEEVLPGLAAASPDTVLVIDEAWAAVHALHPATSGSSALPVLAALRAAGRPVSAIVTQSAHKTLLALRQAAFVHITGSAELVAATRRGYLRTHTSSPSWPIMASLDLARAHAQACGRDAVERALAHRDRLVGELRSDRRTAGLVEDDGPGRNPLMLELRLPPGTDAREVRLRLHREFGIVLARAGHGCLLAHVHIGVRDVDVDAIVRALHALPLRAAPAAPAPQAASGPAVGAVLDGFLVTYPPGVPIAVPGETWTAAHAEVLARHRAGGAEVFHVPSRRPGAPTPR